MNFASKKIKITALLAMLFVGFSTMSYAQTKECTFTYEQGLAMGCSLAQQAMDAGCEKFGVCYDKWAKNTVDKYESTCPEYSRGVREGFQECFEEPEPHSGGATTIKEILEMEIIIWP